jgi:hypothetical protein
MSTEYFTQLLNNIHSSQQPMEPSPKLIKIDHIFRHKASPSKPNRNNPMHSIQSQCLKTRTQQQKLSQKICKKLKAEQHLAQ